MIWSRSTSTGLPNHGALSRQKSLAWNFTNHLWHIWSLHLLHTLHKSFFLHFSCIFTFLEIIERNMPKMSCISFMFNIKMAIQIFTNFDVFFKCIPTWQLSQYILTKLFRMKLLRQLSTTRDILCTKPNELCAQYTKIVITD